MDNAHHHLTNMDRDSDDQSGSEDDAFDDDSVDSWDLTDEGRFIRNLRRVRNNDSSIKYLCGWGNYDIIQNMTNEGWEDLGHVISSNNTYLKELNIVHGALDDETLSSLFRGLSRSSSIVFMDLSSNEFSAAGLGSLESYSCKIQSICVG